MKHQSLCAIAGLALILSSPLAFAGPCTKAIDGAQSQFDARLHAAAAAGPAAAQSTAATAHHQPTPKSIAQAEENLGELSHDQAHAFGEAMERARAADFAGDLKACKAALSDAKAALKG
jgi:hypothetical protein